MEITSKNEGYVLVLTLMILSLLIVVVTSMFFNQTSHSALTSTILNREKAKMLALSGVQLAICKLTITESKANKESQEKAKKQVKQENPQAKLLQRLLPNINNAQTVNLKEETDSIDGQIKFMIISEQSKLNINKLYDFSSHKFFNEGKKEFDARVFLQAFFNRISAITGDKDLFNSLVQYLQKRKFPLNDVTELLEIPEFKYFQNHVFRGLSNENQDNTIFLTDVFTTWTNSFKIEPWLLTDSLINILGLKKLPNDENRKVIVENALKNFKQSFDWKNDWNKVLKPIYGKEFDSLIKGMENLFDSQFNPKIFNVISYGQVGAVIQRVFAIIEIEKDSLIKIKKLYWI